MSHIPVTEEHYADHVRRVCMQCGHAFVWHGIEVGHPSDGDTYVAPGCGVRGCTCNVIDPGDA